MFINGVVTVTSVPTLLFSVSYRRQTVLVRNTDSTDVIKLGGEGVTYATGISLKPDEAMSFVSDQFNRESTAALYGIADTGVSVVVEIMSHISASSNTVG